MNTQVDIKELIESGKIQNELDFERALIVERKLRVLAKENPRLNSIRKKLRDLIQNYEVENWSSDSRISDFKLKLSDLAEVIAEKERLFINLRKEIIKKKLKKLNLNQQELGVILGHKSKSYMSELMNGISPFSLKDLVVIHKLMNIELDKLVPTILPIQERIRIKSSIQKMEKTRLKLKEEEDFVFA